MALLDFRMTAKIAIALIVAGAAMFILGLVLPRYHNAAEYERRYMALEGAERSKEFYELRKQSLTPSFQFQDYGLTTVLIGMIVFAAARWKKVVAVLPQRRTTVAILGVFAAAVTIAADIASLFLDFARGEFPHWADSRGIPLAGEPVIFVILLFWGLLHSLLVKPQGSDSWHLTLRHPNWWPALLLSLTTLVLLSSAVYGDFWQIVPAALWISFYLAIWINRSGVKSPSGATVYPKSRS